MHNSSRQGLHLLTVMPPENQQRMMEPKYMANDVFQVISPSKAKFIRVNKVLIIQSWSWKPSWSVVRAIVDIARI